MPVFGPRLPFDLLDSQIGQIWPLLLHSLLELNDLAFFNVEENSHILRSVLEKSEQNLEYFKQFEMMFLLFKKNH